MLIPLYPIPAFPPVIQIALGTEQWSYWRECHSAISQQINDQFADVNVAAGKGLKTVTTSVKVIFDLNSVDKQIDVKERK